MKAILIRHPEWWAWAFSLFVWALLVKGQLFPPHELKPPGTIIFCIPQGTAILKMGDISPGILTTLSNGLLNWVFMVIAMMFPLLNEPIRHVAFSVRRKDRKFGILWFLVGYTIMWTAIGLLFLLLPLFLNMFGSERMPLVMGLVTASFFALAAASVWFPNRPIRMTKCGQTMPIRIRGRQLHSDSLVYGLKIGFTCLKLCWAPMAALMLAHHNVLVMYLVTSVLIFERYLLPHTSRFSGYAWGIIALTLFGMNI